jgi:hypothetical protein
MTGDGHSDRGLRRRSPVPRGRLHRTTSYVKYRPRVVMAYQRRIVPAGIKIIPTRKTVGRCQRIAALGTSTEMMKSNPIPNQPRAINRFIDPRSLVLDDSADRLILEAIISGAAQSAKNAQNAAAKTGSENGKGCNGHSCNGLQSPSLLPNEPRRFPNRHGGPFCRSAGMI